MSSVIKYIETDELSNILIDSEKLAEANLKIFDVRNESEFSEGHIRGSTNHPSSHWANTEFVESIVADLLLDGQPKTVVMHCAYSQQRGPTCAKILQSHFEKQTNERNQYPAM